MTESSLTVATSTEAGARIDTLMTQVDNANGSTFANDGAVMLLVVSGAVSPVFTMTYQLACTHGVSHSRTYTCTASQTHLIGPFSTKHFCDTNGLAHITWSTSDANTKVLAFRKGSTMG